MPRRPLLRRPAPLPVPKPVRALRWAWPLLLLLGLLPPGVAAQPGGPPPCPPGRAPYYDSASAAPVERYLTRAVAMNGLCDELVPAPFAWNQANDKTPCYQGGPPDDPASYNQNLACQGLCSFAYCPANFAADVALLVQLRATLVQFAASTWYEPEKFIPGSPYLRAAGQTVARINAAYDCAGLPRPLIQASVLENIGTGPVCVVPCEAWIKPGPLGTNSGVNRVLIPPSVIAEFREAIEADSAKAHYLDTAGQPRAGLTFSFFRIGYQFDHAGYSPDITRLEGQMWFFYQAKTYIDLGYTSLHVGQPKVWGRLFEVFGDDRARAMHRVAVLMNRIRRYARSISTDASALLVLTGEPMSEMYPDGRQRTIKLIDGQTADGRDRYLFDFAMATMRPRETSPQLDERAGTNDGTAYPCPAVDPAALNTPACNGQLLATIDPCHGFNFLPDGGGTTALGQHHPSQLPYVVYFDHGSAVVHQPNGDVALTGALTPGNSATWNWDDSAWFSAALSDACQADWLRFQFPNVRSFSPERLGYLAAPGRLTNNVRAGMDLGPGLPDRPEAGVPDYRLAGHPAVAAAVAAAWEPQVPRVAFRATAGAGRALAPCPGSSWRRRTFRQLPAWQLVVENPDATSIYSWHISGPGGAEPVAFGPAHTFLPAAPGAYTITLQQNNLGLPAATRGIYTYAVPAVPAADAACLTRAARRAARRAAAPAPPAP